MKEDQSLLGPLENVVRVRKLRNATGDAATGDAGATGRQIGVYNFSLSSVFMSC